MQWFNHLISGAGVLVTSAFGAELLSGAIPRNVPWITSGIEQVVGYMAPDQFTAGVGIAVYALGLVLPDIDTPTSIVGRKLKHIPGGAWLQRKMGHRTWTHSIWPVLAFLLLSGTYRLFAWLAAGYFVHLLFDAFSRMGVCWLYPFQRFVEYESGAKVKRGHDFWLYRNGSIAENILAWVTCVPAVVLIVLQVT